MSENATKTIRIIICIGLVICIIGGILWNNEKKIISIYEEKINNYLKEKYPDETFTTNFYKRSELRTGECKIFTDECKVYETIPGKYTYSFKATDSNNIEFVITYIEAYDDHMELIEENYFELQDKDVVEVFFSSKIKEILDKNKTKYTFGEVSSSTYYGSAQAYVFPIAIYASNTQNFPEVINKVYDNVFKKGKFDLKVDKDYEIEVDIYILNSIDIFNGVKEKSDFDDLSFCHFNKNEDSESKYICNTISENDNKDTLIQYRLAETKYAGGPIFGPDKYYISELDKENK